MASPKVLAMTSQLVRDTTQSRKRTDDLLYVAGITARRMPKLQAFALWKGIKGEACAFIYHRDGGGASITWRGTWDMQLSPRVLVQALAQANRVKWRALAALALAG
ncbi:hypothetical protein B0H63DRAFT_449526 [Podospora didyma]|uniref:DUF6546 domain-containing protein n=1 Tax=Podospora didyma TaxID=330526 RepID=A0AAE0TZT2_9PEZI|nr:hypothetical protein B0H63DRAFT_449526 [Podospora didyma]